MGVEMKQTLADIDQRSNLFISRLAFSEFRQRSACHPRKGYLYQTGSWGLPLTRLLHRCSFSCADYAEHRRKQNIKWGHEMVNEHLHTHFIKHPAV